MHSSRCRGWQTETFYAPRGGEQKTLDENGSFGLSCRRSQCIVVSALPIFDGGVMVAGTDRGRVTLVYEGDTPNNPKRALVAVVGTKRIIPGEPVTNVLGLFATPQDEAVTAVAWVEDADDDKPVTGVDE